MICPTYWMLKRWHTRFPYLNPARIALTNGGPSGVFMKKAIGMSELLAMNIYNTAYKYSRMAEGQAKAVIFFIVLMIVSVFQVTYSKRKEVEM